MRPLSNCFDRFCDSYFFNAVAIAAGRKLAHRLFDAGKESLRLEYQDIPTVVFSHPPVGMLIHVVD